MMIGALALDIIFKELNEKYPQLLKNIHFTPGSSAETICGQISGQINNFLRKKIGVASTYMSGTYKGRGTEFSGGTNGTGHCWVEFESDLGKVIIDGAFGQFFPHRTPISIKNHYRLMIFVGDSQAIRWYHDGRPTYGSPPPINKNGILQQLLNNKGK